MPSVTVTYNFKLPIIGGDTNTWGGFLNENWQKVEDLLDGSGGTITPSLVQGSWKVGGAVVTASASELNKLDGLTATTAELNRLDGVTATAAEINKLDGLNTPTSQLNLVNGVTSNVQNQLNAKAPLSSPSFTGSPTAPTAAGITNDTRLATTAFVQGRIAGLAPLSSPTFTGSPRAPTQPDSNNSTLIATTAYTRAAVPNIVRQSLINQVGSYMLLRQVTLNTPRPAGQNVAGSDLRYTSAGGLGSPPVGTPSGTWRCMGAIGTASGNADNTTLFLRVI